MMVHTPNIQTVSNYSALKGLTLLMEEEQTDAAIYNQLSRILPGEAGRMLHQMSEQEQAHSACLRGLYTLITGKTPPMPNPSVQVGSVDAMLRTCYGREMRCLARYEARSRDPEYGQIFSRLAMQERTHCRNLLQIIEAQAAVCTDGKEARLQPA